jgi:choline kinase
MYSIRLKGTSVTQSVMSVSRAGKGFKFSGGTNLCEKCLCYFILYSSDLVFEKGYCEYRLNRTRESLATLRSSQNQDLRLKELLAQVVS